MYNYLSKQIDGNIDYNSIKKNYPVILNLLLPFIPHFASECLEEIEQINNISWPMANPKYLVSDNINIVVQINGKKKEILNVKANINEEELLKKIKNNVKISKNTEGKKIVRKIFVPNRLINLILK